MSSVTQVKFEIKPSTRKIANRNGACKSIGNVANSGANRVTEYKLEDKSVTSSGKGNDTGVRAKQDYVSVKGVVAASAGIRSESCETVGSVAATVLKQASAEFKGNLSAKKVSDEIAKARIRDTATVNASKLSASKFSRQNTDVGVKKSVENGSKVTQCSVVSGRKCDTVITSKNNDQAGVISATAQVSDSTIKKGSSCTKPDQEDNETVVVGTVDGAGGNNGNLFASSDSKVDKDESNSAHSATSTTTVYQINPGITSNVNINSMNLISSSINKQRLGATLNNKSSIYNDVNHTRQKSKPDVTSSNAIVEQKLTNPERAKMLAQGLQEEIIKRRKLLDMAKGQTMEKEKKIDIGDERSEDENVVEIIIAGDQKVEAVNDIGPTNMIDELQNYLRKRFGSVGTSNIQETNETSKFDNDSPKVSSDKSIDLKSNQNVDTSTSVDQTVTNKTPLSPNAFLPHPIFFKTSIKKDPGSKLHDQLLKELGSVLRKKDGNEDASRPNVKENHDNDDNVKDGFKFPKRRISTKGNKILGNKALLASLENQLQRTLHKNKIFQRQKLKVIDLEAIELTDNEKDSLLPSEQCVHSSETSSAKLILDSEQLHREEEDQVMSVINELDMSIQEHSEGPSQTVNRWNASHMTSHVTKAQDYGINEPGNQELFVYTYENASGRNEGVVCSVESRQSTTDSRGRPRKFLTCINIMAEKSVECEEGNITKIVTVCST